LHRPDDVDLLLRSPASGQRRGRDDVHVDDGVDLGIGDDPTDHRVADVRPDELGVPDRVGRGDHVDADDVIDLGVLSQSPRFLTDERSLTQGSVTIGGQKLEYQAEAGLLVVHLTDPMDEDPPLPKAERDGPLPPQQPEAAMSYVAYFKGKAADPRRPVTFIFNGGPGSSTVWLHMGAFGPKRVLTLTDSHTPAAPYRIVNNDYSLLDASDLVFIDAPGTGFGHLRGHDKEKAFFGVDPDANAFANFIVEFLSRHGRWNSPK